MEWYPCEICGQAHPFKVTASKRCPNQSSRGGGESRPARRINHPSEVASRVEQVSAETVVVDAGKVAGSNPRPLAGVATGPREAIPSSDATRPISRKPKPIQPPHLKALAVASGAITTKVGRPLASQAHLTIAHQKPWIKLGMSRTTWFRRQAEKRANK